MHSLPRILATFSGILIAIVIPMVGVAVVQLYVPTASLIHLPLHSLLETMGGVMALTIAGMLVARQCVGVTEPHKVWMACGLAGMGTLDLFHAAMLPGDNFVWLHSASTLVGGLLFLGVWLRRPVSSVWALWLPAVVFPASGPRWCRP